MKKLLLLATISLIIGCNSSIKESEYNSLNEELAECKKTVEDLQNTPEIRFVKGQKYLSDNDIASAKEEFNNLIKKFSESDEAKKAKSIIEEIEKKEKAEKEAEEKKRMLGYKILKETNSVKVRDVTLKFNSIKTGNEWVFDNYGHEWRYRSAERGEKYILSKLSISSETKNPYLPPIGVYKMMSGNLHLISPMGYEFSRWEDYGSYLGNYSDYGNDFAHTKTIRFSVGASISENVLNESAVFVVVQNINCVVRETDRFSQPPVKYVYSNCELKRTLSIDDFDSDYTLIKILNKNKM